MKAIKITQELKDKNEFFSKKAVGSVYKGSLPNKFYGSKNITGGYRKRDDLHENDGWYTIVTPVFSEDEKLDSWYFDEVNKIFTCNVVKKTTEELLEEDKRKLLLDISSEKARQWKADGVKEYQNFQANIWRKVQEGISINQAITALEYFDEIVAPLDRGAWIIVDSIIKSKEQEILLKPALYQTFFEKIKNIVTSYIQNNYK